MLIVLFVPLPVKTKLTGSANVVSVLDAVTTSEARSVSASPIVNPTGPVGVSSRVVTFVKPVIVGKVFTETIADAVLFVELESAVMDETTAVLVL